MDLLNWKQWRICHILLAITFFTSGIIINAVQALLYYCVRPWNKRLFRKLNYYPNYALFSQMMFFAQYWGDIQLTVHCDSDEFKKHFGNEHVYLMMNHTYEIDWLVGWIHCDDAGILGNCKTYGKKSIQYIPTMGWAWKFGESVFLERSWDKDKQIIGNQLNELVDYPDPMWLLLTAEGTRFTPEKHEACMTFAKEKGLPILKHHLTPRTRGFTTSLPYLRGKVPAIHNVVLAIPNQNVPPTMTSVLMGKTIKASMYVERIPLEEVPENEEEAAKWLHELFKKKDAMIESFMTTGSFSKTSGVRDLPGKLVKPRIAPLANTLMWMCIVTIPLLRYLGRIVLTGNLFTFVVCVLIISSFTHLLNRIIGETEISRGSSYGASNPTTPVNANNEGIQVK